MRRGADLTGFSGLGALLSGAADGFTQGQRISSQRNADKLAREREERYERERQAQEEERRLARERQGALDALAGILPADSVNTDERITLRDNSAVRGGMDAANRALASLAPGSGFTPLLAGPEDQTTERYRQVGSRVIDRSIADPEVKRIRAEEEARVERGNARRGLLALRGPDGEAPLFRPEEVLGQQASGIAALQQYGATAGVREREKAAERRRLEDELAKTRGGLEVVAKRYGVDPTGLDDESLRAEVDTARQTRAANQRTAFATNEGIRGARAKAEIEGTVGGGGKPLSQGEEKRLLDLNENLVGVRDALSLLGEVKPDGTMTPSAAATNAFSLRNRMLPDFAVNRMDPQGVEARQAVAAAVSGIRNRLYGSALTASEIKNLEPYIPSNGDDPQTTLRKLRGLEKEMQSKINARIAGLKALGRAVPEGFGTPNATGGTASTETTLSDLLENY